MAFVGKSALATGNTTVTPVYAGAVAGNLLTAFVTANQTTATAFTLSGATTGWSAVVQEGDLTVEAEIWQKIAVGSDTMPTWQGGTSLMECEISEFSTTVTLDQSGGASGTLSPETVTAAGIDGGTGRLIIGVRKMRAAAATTTTTTDNVNSLGVGTGINILGSNISTSQNSWHFSFYVTTAVTGSVADNDVATWSATTVRSALAIASFAGATTIALTGTIGATGGVSGVSTEAMAAAGTIGATGSAGGTETLAIAARGAIGATGALSGAGTEAIAAAGSIGATGALSGTDKSATALSGSIGATGGLSGTSTEKMAAAGAIGALGGMAATGKEAIALAGAIGASTGLAGSETFGLGLGGSIGALGSVGGTITLVLPPPVFGPPSKLERRGTQSLHVQPGNQLTRTPVHSLHKQTQ